ncbi:ABC transporter ATP-binding protein [uncultured Aquimarina sp.]|uniref:ATP-binding cassette domain-containing protein n=1 Tax=uncultured Aquimarina sp. TaxID=575652 RepID=UPI00261C8BE1|nr:ABC transporter ATP-binding protein [uncultured Aquimarina sp.]
MKKLIEHIKYLIPQSKRKRLPFFFSISIVNSILDFISIAFLTPFILLIIDKQKVDDFLVSHFGITYQEKHILYALITLIIFYLLKNLLQTKIVSRQSKYLYSIGTLLSKKLVSNFTYGNYEKYYLIDNGQLIRDFHKLPTIFVTNILIPIYHLTSEIIILSMIMIAGFILNPLATIFSIVFVSISALLLLFLRKGKTQHFNEIISKSYRDTLNNLMNILNGIIEIKSSKSESDFINRFGKSYEEQNDTLASLSTFKQNNVRYLEVMTIVFISFSIAFILLNSSSMKDLVLLSFYGSAVIKIIPSFNKIINAYIDLKSNKHAVDILASYKFDQPNELNDNPFENSLRLENINFNYPNNDLIISNCSLEIKKGDFIGIMGKSGCGKTTLLHIICRMLPFKSGKIVLDENAITNTTSLPFVYMLSQHSFIFQGTLIENITMNKTEDIDYNYINHLFDSFDLKDWLLNLDEGFDTVLNIDSKSISGGQKQRLALIRALYTRPKILLLDEATNQLNEDLEIKIMTYLKNETTKNELSIVAVFHNKGLSKFAEKHYTFRNSNLIKG